MRFDRAQLIQVMNNLVDNAIRHAALHSTVRVLCQDQGEKLRISVENAGEQIPPEELPKVWDRYHRAPKQGEAGGLGTGLGLAIVKHVAQNHNGDVRVWSQQGRGSTFTIRIPEAEPVSANPSRGARP